jgi:hypothetical protein
MPRRFDPFYSLQPSIPQLSDSIMALARPRYGSHLMRAENSCENPDINAAQFFLSHRNPFWPTGGTGPQGGGQNGGAQGNGN